MWSLPDINRMNSEAAQKEKVFEKQLRTGRDGRKKIKCDHDNDQCQGEVSLTPWYDIFGPWIRGVSAECERHSGYDDSLFYCEGCERNMALNYTWEYYRVDINGLTLCLQCALTEYLGEEENWTPLTDEAIDGLTFDKVRKAKHLIGVNMPHEGLTFLGNTEFDSGNGRCISGGGPTELQDLMQQAREQGYTKAVVILDGAYQFAVSLGLYVPEKDGRFDTRGCAVGS